MSGFSAKKSNFFMSPSESLISVAIFGTGEDESK